MQHQRRRGTWALACLAWAAAVGVAMFGVFAYSMRAGASATVQASWPREIMLTRDPNKPTVVFVAHPRCPCTRASISELAQIVTRSEGHATFHVLFIRPDGVDDGWGESDTFRRASELPSVTVTIDRGGKIASRLGVTTSGHVLVYDAAGTLVFSGGITPSRGHEGDNTGRRQVLALLASGAAQASASRTLTFGCALYDEDTRPEAFAR